MQQMFLPMNLFLEANGNLRLFAALSKFYLSTIKKMFDTFPFVDSVLSHLGKRRLLVMK